MKKTAFLLFILTSIYCYGQNIDLDNGLVAYLSFDNNINDKSGNSNNGISKNQSEYTSGIINEALKLTNKNYIVIKNPKQKFSNTYSISIWASNFNTGAALFSKYSRYDKDSTGKGFMLFYSNDSQNINGFTGNTMHLVNMFNQPWFEPKHIKYLDPPNQMKHFVAIFNQDTAKLYVNGLLIEKITYPKTSSLNNPYDIIIGSYTIEGSKVVADETNHTFEGIVDEFRLYNRALTNCEIQELYNQGASGGQKMTKYNCSTNNFLDTELEIKKEIEVKSFEIKIKIWDNAKEDGDIVSVFINDTINCLIPNLSLKKKRLNPKYRGD